MARSKITPWREALTLWRIYILYRNLKPDIVHHVTIKPVIYGSLASRLAGVPAVVNAISGLGHVFIAQGLKAVLIRNAVKMAYRFSFRHPNIRVIFQNPDDVSLFREANLVRAGDVVLIKGSGVDIEAFRPFPEPEGIPIVLFASRLLWDKGIHQNMLKPLLV